MNIRAFFRRVHLDFALSGIKRQAERNYDKFSAKKQRVLFTMSFSIYEPCRVHDFLLAQALKLRGAEIIPLICGKAQQGECNVFGGIWGGYSGDEKKDKVQSLQNCKRCLKQDLKLWKEWMGLPPLSLADYLTKEDIEFIERKISEYKNGEHRSWQYEGMPVGQWAVDAMINNDMVGDEKLVDQYQRKLRRYLRNIFILVVTVEKALKDIRPDVIVSNDSFYYQWAIIQHLARKHSIPFYSHWQGGKRNGWCYAMGEPAMKLNIQPAWESWKKIPLTDDEEKKIDDFLKDRKSGRSMVMNTADPKANSPELEPAPSLDLTKPTALLAANVIWDLSVLNKEIQFRSMIEWIIETIAFFKDNPQWQLIVKAHPTEENWMLPRTRQQVGPEIRKVWSDLPANVVFLKPKTNVSVYDLIDKVKVGLVYTTTVGLEMASAGVPVVTAGRSHYYGNGFTYDTTTVEEYRDIIKKLFTSSLHQVNNRSYKELARKFFYFYHFKYYMSLNLFDATYASGMKLTTRSYKELLPGHNPVLDHVCDSILGHLPIIGENRWPPL